MTFVYVIQAENGPVRIGVSDNPHRQLSTLRNGSSTHFELVYIGVVSGDLRAVERRTHQILSDNLIAGDWFRTTQDDAVTAIVRASAEFGSTLERTDIAVASGTPTTSIRQVKAARALLGWSQEELARRSGVSVVTIKRLEKVDDHEPIGGRLSTAMALQGALEAAGVIFIAENGEGVGVRLRKTKP